MNDAEYEFQKDRIVAAVWRWKSVLPLSVWQIDQDVFRGNIPDAPFNVVGETKPLYEYMRAKIRWNVEYIHQEQVDDDELDKFVVHELLHCLLDRFTHFARSTDETMPSSDVEQDVTIMTHAVVLAYMAGWRDAKDSLEPDIYDQIAASVAV